MEDADDPKPMHEVDSIEVFTDGSCLGNPGPGGYAAIVKYMKSKQTIEEVIVKGRSTDTTNNQMELHAATAALKSIKDKEIPVCLTTDCKYMKEGITKWITKWKRNKWKTCKGDTVKNKQLWKTLDQSNSQMKIQWTWTSKHSGHTENKRADKIAKSEAKSAQRERKRNNRPNKDEDEGEDEDEEHNDDNHDNHEAETQAQNQVKKQKFIQSTLDKHIIVQSTYAQ